MRGNLKELTTHELFALQSQLQDTMAVVSRGIKEGLAS